MKKREGLKNFPDQRISALLREKDQLLKSIHDRLGIILHAKAEVSDGAEASLNRIEFRDLSEQTSVMYLEGNVQDTVDTLMEATIERLVFVNTPESSDHVRFDIRQLQEFFAAEFIHNAVEDAEFHSRFELICGDAHWREVVHFLLSALAHHKKLSALTMASSILQQLDYDNDNHKFKTFKKRMGIGAILTLRLLEEGVLEQDKGIRNQFSKTITPIWGMIEKNIISRILSIKKEQSLNWLTNNLIDSFLDLDYSEHMAAGHYLSVFLDENHPRFQEIIYKIKQAPYFYWNTTLDLYIHEPFESNNTIPKKWFIALVIDTFLSEKTNDLDLLNCMYYFLSNFRKEIYSHISNINLSNEDIDIITQLFPYKNEDKFMVSDNLEREENTYCFVTKVNHDITWKRNFKIEGFKVITSDKKSLPVELFKSAVNFCFSQKTHDYRNFLLILKNINYQSHYLPENLKALIPLRFEVEFIKKNTDALLDMDDTLLSKFLLDKILDGEEILEEIAFLALTETDFESRKWALFCNDYPLWALRIPLQHFFNRLNIIEAIKKERENFFQPILTLANKEINIFSKAFFIWGDVFKTFPEYELELREKLLKCDPRESIGVFQPANQDFYFTINKISEKKFLEFLSFSLLNYKNIGQDQFTDPSYILGIRYDEDFIKKFGLDNNFLINTALDHTESSTLRASCLSLYITQEFIDKKAMLADFFDTGLASIVPDIYTPDTKIMISGSIYLFLRNLNAFDSQLKEFLGEYTNIIKDDYESRRLIQNIYIKWRERSFAVVQNSQSLDSWLKYTYNH